MPPASGNMALLNLGFRPFFAVATMFSLLAVLIWLGVYVLGWPWSQQQLSPLVWHAHEMVFGYAMAVIAGFLLTAVKNWTGVQTLRGLPLLLLVLAWLAGRVLLLAGGHVPLYWAALADCIFGVGLTLALAYPIFKVRQWKQMGILSKIVLLLCSNLLFYAGLLGVYPEGVQIGLYSGVYLVMALVFAMARRVLPFFIERGMGHPVTLINRKWLDIASLVLFLVFWIADVLQPDSLPVALLAAVLFVLHALRLAGWYASGIFKVPLLSVLYLGYGWLVAGFALKAAVYVTGISPSVALHAFTYGGIGLFTLGMMARVTLGHTGRSLNAPPVVGLATGLMLVGALVRVLLPLLDAGHYTLWIGLSQVLWMLAFALLLLAYLPMWLRPRVDGQPG
jgi:uncharacterized protein involved in response to NO